MALEKTTLEISQSVDNVKSKIDRLTESQSKFISGELSDQDLLNLLEDYSDFFSDDKNVENFIKGKNII